MTTAFTAEQDDLRASVRAFLADKAPSAAVRRWMDSDEGYDRAVWRQLADQLGLPGLAIPESYGGAGGSAVELGIVLEEMGRTLLPGPYFATVALATQALLASEDEDAKARWLPRIADGSLTATLAVGEDGGSWNLDDVRTTAVADSDAWRVSGAKMFVVDGDSAGLVLVIARADDGLGLFAVEGGTRIRLTALDPTRRLARVELDDVPAVRIVSTMDGLRRALDLAVVALAAEQVGGAQACLDAAVEYAKIRVQFNRPIGSFQAIKHKCANMLLELEAARSAVYHAAAVAGTDELAVAAAVAGSYCAEAYTHIAKENIQIHGGIGYTWEHDAQLYLKRAKASELLFGAPAWHRARLADLVGI
ncbi:acyl-CoA/acyl-ACP dehydrogenase [Amycolatopsis acidiphila]|uniref:Acyl-CoA dehydrogenase n=1 Tax=Amycolatopsis acidiphila TaxID=715473 RepID=A0A557ZZK4_9PSEU|nr:acyl-CoA dehydrogenase family protein [Amycolatopsis acidiphila]TVT17427.1 acyl-CoA dehydrogenase [Amycolatopsis acidiphila]UIJ57272.1 acyl-CoA/acyl-ACP dehydrogenase [Amycolatopsis acidiphila]GHG52335.1 acyl-CoA dehydrogenase [Amycolatopsis acidiphila]